MFAIDAPFPQYGIFCTNSPYTNIATLHFSYLQHTYDCFSQTKLRDDSNSRPSSGLSRSHSSPNIAKMLQDEEERRSVLPVTTHIPKPKPK